MKLKNPIPNTPKRLLELTCRWIEVADCEGDTYVDDNNCMIYSADEFKNIAFSAIRFIVDNTTYCNQLMQYIKTLISVSDVESITYGQPLTGIYLENYNRIMNNLPIDKV